MEGTASGSSVANTAGAGSFTIPAAAAMPDELMNGIVRARRSGTNTYGLENIAPKTPDAETHSL